jgi:hypothetical protein
VRYQTALRPELCFDEMPVEDAIRVAQALGGLLVRFTDLVILAEFGVRGRTARGIGSVVTDDELWVIRRLG